MRFTVSAFKQDINPSHVSALSLFFSFFLFLSCPMNIFILSLCFYLSLLFFPYSLFWVSLSHIFSPFFFLSPSSDNHFKSLSLSSVRMLSRLLYFTILFFYFFYFLFLDVLLFPNNIFPFLLHIFFSHYITAFLFFVPLSVFFLLFSYFFSLYSRFKHSR